MICENVLLSIVGLTNQESMDFELCTPYGDR